MAKVRAGSGDDGRFLIAGKACGTGVERWVAPELGRGDSTNAVPADAVFERVYAITGNGEASLLAVVAAVERGWARDVLITPEAVAAA